MPAQPLTRLINVGPSPPSPWLRLAHITGVQPEHASHTARLRVLTDFELVFQIEGSCWIWSDPDGGSFDVQAGDLAFIPPGYMHGWANEPGYHIAVHFDLRAQPRMEAMDNICILDDVVRRKPVSGAPRFNLISETPDAPALSLPLINTLRAPALWRERLMPLVELYSRRAHRSWTAQLRAAETLGWALRTLSEDAAQAAIGSAASSDARILDLVRTLELPGAAGLGQRPSVDELAERAGMGLTAFRESFARAMGRGPRQYLEERRIERAARALLETERKVLQIALAEGYDDPYHFSRAFRRVMGASPRQYRAKRSGL